MRVAITGSKGQLGSSLQQVLEADAVLAIDLPEHDITDREQIARLVGEFQPDIVIHAAAMTDVDGCERDPELAERVNVLGTRNMATAAKGVGCPLIYISTDYVFDGMKGEPYGECDVTHPLSVYGRTKCDGERAVQEILARHYIVRPAWLYSDGPSNFVKTVLRLAAAHPKLSMVTDEVGSPTYVRDLAHALEQLMHHPQYGIYHLTNVGTCSRYEWAKEVLALSGITDVELLPSQDYPRSATVPKRVELLNTKAKALGITMRPWRDALESYFRMQAVD